MHPTAARPRRSILARLLALAVLLGTLVAVPALTSPASADADYTGRLKVGHTITTVRSDEVFEAIYYYDSAGCTGPQVDSERLDRKSYTFPESASGRWAHIVGFRNEDEGGFFRYCQGPIAPEVEEFSSFTTASYTGTPVVGDPLTADRPSVPADATVTYSWAVLLEGSPVEVSTDPTYTPERGYRGEDLTLTVTAAEDGFVTRTRATPPAPIGAASFGDGVFEGMALVDSSPTTPLRAGDTLTVAPSTGAVPEDTTFSTRFGTATTGTDPTCQTSGDDAASYSVTSDDAGTTLCAVVSAYAQGYRDVSTTLYSTTVESTFEGGAAVLDGTPTVGRTVSASVEGVTPDEFTPAYVWSIDGRTVSTTAAYAPVPEDVGRTVSVTVTASREGYADRSYTVSDTVTKGTPTGGSVTLSTTRATVGGVVTVTPTAPSPGSAAALVWTVDGAVVARNTSSYRPKAVDAGRTLTVTATWSATGYEDVVRTASTAKIAAAAKKVVVDRTSVRRGQSFVVTATGLKAGQQLDVLLAGTKVGSTRADEYGSVTRTVVFPKATKPGKKLEVRVDGFVRTSKGLVRDYKASTSITLTR